MILGQKTNNALSLLLCGIGLAGAAYSLWNLLVLSDVKAIPALVVSIVCITGAYGFLIRGNPAYPRALEKCMYLVLVILFFFWALSSAYFSGNPADAHYQMMIAILAAVLVFAYIFEILWRNRIR